MNKIQISSLVFFLSALSLHIAQAQSKGESQISIGYGTVSIYEFANSIFEDTESTGVLNLGYKYAVKNRFMVGVNLSYEQIKGTNSFFNIFGGDNTATSEFSALTIAIETDYRYISKPSFQMYSGIGLAYVSTDEFNNNFSFQATALGFRVGKKLAAFAELGFGYKGIAQIGASYQF